MRKFIKITGLIFLVLIITSIFWIWKNWVEAGRHIKLSENYQTLVNANAKAPETENQKVLFDLIGYSNHSYWPCSILHGQMHVSQHIGRNFITSRSHIKRGFVACRLERDYPFSQLRNYHFNTVYVGKGEFGLDTLSKSLFDTTFEDLSQEELVEVTSILRHPSKR